MTQKYLITTTIPYVNSQPHVGHAQEFALADAWTRQLRKQGAEVFLQSGTDDNAFKNVLSARAAGVEPRQFVDSNAEKFVQLQTALEVFPDVFIRTSSESHRHKVTAFLKRLRTEDLYEKAYAGFYCQGCEDFLDSTELIDGLCIDHRRAPECLQEDNIFFRLSRYQEQIKQAIESDQVSIQPSFRKKEILNFIEKGLTDISISRSSIRSEGWGVPYPEKPEQVVYIWIDALINYWSERWTDDFFKLHVIGKNVWKFHAIYWIGLLLSAGLPLPNLIFIHGFLTNNGVKISKSLGNGGDPRGYVENYGADALRFYLLSALSFTDDADFSEEQLKKVYNTELANKLGNLVSRVIALCERSDFKPPLSGGESATTAGDFAESLKQAFTLIAEVNAEIHTTKPWEQLIAEPRDELHALLSKWVKTLDQVRLLLEPVLPQTSQRLQQILRTGRKEALFPRL